MGDYQCGLCLSCGVPFFPRLDNVEFFNREGVQSIVFLSTEYRNDRQIQALYRTPRFASEKHQAHMFHSSHHFTALEYMCTRHRNDMSVGVGAGPAPAGAGPALPVAGAVVQNQVNAPLLYFHAPTSRTNKGPQAAIWDRPNRRARIKTGPLLRLVLDSAHSPHARPIRSDLTQTFDTCDGCNYLMTQLADIRYIVGYRAAGRRNPHGPAIRGQPVRQYPCVMHNHDLDTAYGNWTFANNLGGAPILRPARDDADSDTPHVAYYLHLCLPYRPNTRPHDVFRTDIANAALRVSARTLFVEQCWLMLVIASIATLVEEGKVTSPNEPLSHGRQQHLGVLDLYVSFFVFRIVQFALGNRLGNTGLDFVQWHQKYYWDALRSPDLFPRGPGRLILGQRMYSTTAQPSRELIEQLCKRLVWLTRIKLRPLILHVAGMPNVPRGIRQYFAPVDALRIFRTWSAQSVSTDFQSSLSKFGIGALIFRIVDLCRDCPQKFKDLLADFRNNWQRLEIDRVRRNTPDMSLESAFRVYYLCGMIDAPNVLPPTNEEFFAVAETSRFTSHWNAVLALRHVGAFREPA